MYKCTVPSCYGTASALRAPAQVTAERFFTTDQPKMDQCGNLRALWGGLIDVLVWLGRANQRIGVSTCTCGRRARRLNGFTTDFAVEFDCAGLFRLPPAEAYYNMVIYPLERGVVWCGSSPRPHLGQFIRD
jgi:hypothetical protein